MKARLSGSKPIAAAALAAISAFIMAGAAHAQRPPTQINPLDRSDLGRSKQDPGLKGIPVPPTVTAVEKLPLDKIKLPRGFSAEVWAHSVPGARTMIQGPKGTYFIGTRTIGRVYAVVDKGASRETKTLIQGLTQPNGLLILNGALYVFAINKVLRYDNIEDRIESLPGIQRVTANHRTGRGLVSFDDSQTGDRFPWKGFAELNTFYAMVSGNKKLFDHNKHLALSTE